MDNQYYCFTFIAMNIIENCSLKQFNTFGIEANARYFCEFFSFSVLRSILCEPKFRNIPKLILGGGSNLLFTGNFNGMVLKNNMSGITLLKEDDTHYFVKIGAGEPWHRVVMYCIAHNYAGVENLSLIPGSAGAAPLQNIGAYGVEFKDIFEELDTVNIHNYEMIKFSKTDCQFGYRESIFKNKLKGQFVITSVTLKLDKVPKFNTTYGAIDKELDTMGVKELSIQSIAQAVMNIRRSKLPDPEKIGNAGSFFKNPEIDKAVFEKLKSQFPDIVSFPGQNSHYKLAAGWMIEQCGWKGKRVGDAGVHKDQALVLVNYGNARGQEILDLSRKINDSVKKKFGIELEREVNIV